VTPAGTDERLKVLVLSTYDGTDAEAVRDYLLSFRLHSRHDHYYVFDCRRLDGPIDLTPFDVIVIFWDVYLPGPDLARSVREQIARASALKVVFLQDEHRDVHAVTRAMAELNVHVALTCVAECDHGTFYPVAVIPTLEGTYTVLPGYVPRYLEGAPPVEDTRRAIDVGYRSRAMPHHLGDLGQEKTLVAERFQAVADTHGLVSDISVREHDRLYGRPWRAFLRACRCVLGTSSGASVVDFTGTIRRNCERHLALYPDARYAEVKALWFADVDGQTVIDTVSPRVFEATALGCTLVQHEGAYGGVLRADEHYISIRRDYSNIDDVVDRIRDHAFCREMARRAHRDLVASGRYTFETFVRWFDGVLEKHVPRSRRTRSVSSARFYAGAYRHWGQAMIPWGRSFVVAPSTQLAQHLARLGLARLPRARRGRVFARLIHNPAGIVRKGWAAGRALRRDRALRVLLRVHRSRSDLWPAVPLYAFLDDLLRLAIIRGVLEMTLKTRQRFTVGFEHDENAQALVVVSVPSGPDEPGAPAAAITRRLPDGLREALAQGKIRTIVWDHAAVAGQVVYRSGRRRWLTFTLGAGGVYRFRALDSVYRAAPEPTGQALIALFDGGSAG
jgi:hypothetical protein